MNLRSFQMPQILSKICNFTLRWHPVLGNISLEQNLSLKTLDFLLFIHAIFYLLFCCSTANFWLLFRKQPHSPHVKYCIWAINFWYKGDSEGVGSVLLIECPVGFNHNDITHLATHTKL